MASDKKQGEAFYERASPILLSQQEVDPKREKLEKIKEAKDWQELRSHLEQRLMGLRAWRNSWWMLNWSNLAEFILPRRSILLTQTTGGFPTPNNMVRGQPINDSIIDPTATYAARVCAAGLMTALASPSREWFKIKVAIKGFEVDSAGREWLDQTEERIYTVLAQSNFYNAFAQECEDNVTFGTAPSIIYEDEEDVIRVYNPAVGEYYLSSSATMRIDGLYRTYVMTTAQAIDFFGAERSSDEIKKMWQQKGNALDQEKIVAHSIEPNFGIGKDNIGKVAGGFAWREVYWVYGSGAAFPLSIRGFVECPFTVARWSIQSNDAYGRSPGMDVLPDVMQLQHESKKKAEAIEKQVNPPLIADITMKNQPSSSIPGDVTYVANLGNNEGMRPMYTVNPDIEAMMQDIQAIQERIKKGFFNDVFMAISALPGDQRTATEISQRVSEALQVLGPVSENTITESLEPKLKRIYAIMKRKGFIDEPPDSLKGIPLKMDFVSTLTLAQRGSQSAGIERLVAFIGNLAAAKPEALDNLNVDRVIQEMNEMLGNTDTILFDQKEIAQVRDARAKQQQQMQQMQAMQHTAQTASIGADAANTMSNTQIGGGKSALDTLLNGV